VKQTNDDQNADQKGTGSSKDNPNHYQARYLKITIDVIPIQGPNEKILKQLKKILDDNDISPDVYPSNIYNDKQKRLIILSYREQEREKYDRAMQFKIEVNIEDPDSEQEGIVPIELTKTGSFKMTEEQKLSKKEEIAYRTLVINGVPITITPKHKWKIGNALERFGEIESIRIVKQKINKEKKFQLQLYNQAYVVFKSRETIDLHFRQNNNWSILIDRDILTVNPLRRSKEEFDERNAHTVQLSGLPAGTTGLDLMQILTDIGAKTCFIPRTPTENYSLARYAYINFVGEDEINNLPKDLTFQKGKAPTRKLFWSDPKQHICNICGNPNHLAKECDMKETFKSQKKEQTIKRRQNALNNPMGQYKENIKKFKQSYAAAAKSANQQNDDNESNKSANSNIRKKQKVKEHETEEDEEGNVIKFNKQYQEMRKQLLNTISSLQNDINKLSKTMTTLKEEMNANQEEFKIELINLKHNNQEEAAKRMATKKRADIIVPPIIKGGKRTIETVNEMTQDEASTEVGATQEKRTDELNKKFEETTQQNNIRMSGLEAHLGSISNAITNLVASLSPSGSGDLMDEDFMDAEEPSY
jgi:hypothetical protein